MEWLHVAELGEVVAGESLDCFVLRVCCVGPLHTQGSQELIIAKGRLKKAGNGEGVPRLLRATIMLRGSSAYKGHVSKSESDSRAAKQLWLHPAGTPIRIGTAGTGAAADQ